ncbi:MAG: UDP-N-acetylmuramate--L-alanine ligase [Actinomycetales bacterium]|nr:UDP-N-acetylmuramate--L-alanine ligase [Actinomycetales bacterium]
MKLQELTGKRVHFIGIGGSGMSGLARIAISHGIKVSGSDSSDSSVLNALRALGAEVFIGHKAENVSGADLIVFSNAIKPNNPEREAGKNSGIQEITRASALALLMSDSVSIAVAGTHGKTTTSSMATVALQSAGVDPSFAIGGILKSSGSNAHRGTGKYFVAEADESDGSFVAYHPHAAIITNVEWDHVDHFKSEAEVFQAFEDFVTTITGFLVYCADDEGASKIAASAKIKTIGYGKSDKAVLKVDQISLSASGSTARVLWNGAKIGTLELSVPGEHNVLNAAAVLAVGLELGLSATSLLDGLIKFHGAGRRFELKGSVGGIRVIDDYGHHPTEINVTLTAAKRYAGGGRLLVIFQPHRYSRTKAFMKEFAQSLSIADHAWLLEVYAASEQPITGVSSANIVKLMTSGTFEPNFIAVTEAVAQEAKPGDVIITLGAGDVSSLGPIILEELSKRFN